MGPCTVGSFRDNGNALCSFNYKGSILNTYVLRGTVPYSHGGYYGNAFVQMRCVYAITALNNLLALHRFCDSTSVPSEGRRVQRRSWHPTQWKPHLR